MPVWTKGMFITRASYNYLELQISFKTRKEMAWQSLVQEKPYKNELSHNTAQL